MKEHHYRSVIKGATWRVCATMDTIILSYIFTGQISTALKIGAVEVLTKIALFYAHERIWMRFGWWRTEAVGPNGRSVVIDNHYRSVIKGASYRFFGTLDTIVIALLVTGNYAKAFSIGVTEVFTKIGLFYLHERLWYNISWGMIQDEIPTPAPTPESVRLPAEKPVPAESI